MKHRLYKNHLTYCFKMEFDCRENVRFRKLCNYRALLFYLESQVEFFNLKQMHK